MRTIGQIGIAALLFAAVAATPARAAFGSGGAYAITAAATLGGGASNGGAYVLQGTAGQAGSGRSSGGGFALEAGMWQSGITTLDVPPPLAAPPESFAFHAAQPNPFVHETRFVLDLPASGPVRLELYDMSGRRVRTLVAGEAAAGRLTARWDATDDSGRPLAAGVYLARVATHDLHATRKVVLLSERGE